MVLLDATERSADGVVLVVQQVVETVFALPALDLVIAVDGDELESGREGRTTHLPVRQLPCAVGDSRDGDALPPVVVREMGNGWVSLFSTWPAEQNNIKNNRGIAKVR